MSRRDAAIHKYQRLLPEALSSRYGGAPPYRPAQVKRKVSDLGLNEHYDEYACLLFCDEKALESSVFTEEKIADMREVVGNDFG